MRGSSGDVLFCVVLVMFYFNLFDCFFLALLTWHESVFLFVTWHVFCVISFVMTCRVFIGCFGSWFRQLANGCHKWEMMDLNE